MNIENINKNSLIIFGYSEIVTLGLVINSKLNKVKEFNILDENNEDKFFNVISSFVSSQECFNNVLFSCGPGSFTTIRRIISYVKALKLNSSSDTKFIGLNHLFIIACCLNHKYKISNQSYILSILNYSKDHFVQIYQKKKNSHLFPDSLSEIENVELDNIKNYLDTLSISIQNVYSVYLGSNPNSVLCFNNIQMVNRSDLLEILIKISNLVENNKMNQVMYKHFFIEKLEPLYGKLPSTN